jgi:NADH-quinone oxidoreductase subunit E
MDRKHISTILDRYEGKQGILIQVLLDIQKAYNWIPPEAIAEIYERFHIPISTIYRITNFYKAMSLTPKGRHCIRVCLGTACHVRGAQKVFDKVKEVLGLEKEGTTNDLRFTVERVNCLGCCAMGPVMTVDDTYYGNVTQQDIKEIINQYE